MPQELPGFYFDAEKNRYFPIKGPVPGSSSKLSTKKMVSKSTQAAKLSPRIGVMTSKLLHGRELNGKFFASNRGKLSFEEEFQKIQASRPDIWRYRGTDNVADSTLEQMLIDLQTPEGQTETDFLLAGGINGSLSFLEVGKDGKHFDYGVTCIPNHVWPSGRVNLSNGGVAPQHIWRPPGASVQTSSRISSLKVTGKYSSLATGDSSRAQHALITTLGSEFSGGYVYILSLIEPIDATSMIPQRMHVVAPFSCTIWTADYNSHTSQAVIGTNVGAALVNVETGTSSWVCHCKSDVLAQQFDQSGNLVLCGLRNGAIVTVDVREKQGVSARLIKHRIPYLSSERSGRKPWFELKGHISLSSTVYMPSSISSLASLQLYDQYFLASSMDGSIKLYDHRLTKRGAVQSYEGHINSHTRIRLGVDQSERFVMSGGEDCYLRLWSIKSGKLIFEDKFSESVLSTICWRRSERGGDGRLTHEEELYGQCPILGAWLGSQEGIFHMQWS
ncbi:hypothetical protein SLE2022_163640 [Rubroshorea leprosula]